MTIAASELRHRAQRWHRAHGPVRGWEGERDPYVILVREVMSQQTQIARVIEALPRFLERFPTLRALAEGTPAAVIEAWRGLGYNRRALALHGTALACMQRFGGTLPEDLATLRTLPGIGPYTAAAIAVFAFGARTPVVDTNIRRVLTRASGTDDAEDAMRALLHRVRDPRAVTQAIMDLGALVCTPTPRCDRCPIASVCETARAGTTPNRSGRRQGRFEGSSRQLRGQLIDALRDRPSGVPARRLSERFGARTAAALDALERDGLLERDGARVRLPAGFAR